jgi:hypothetical protein
MLCSNHLRALPESFGQRLPDLREVDLSDNDFASLPLRALAGATSLEKIDFVAVVHSKIEVPPLDFLLENHPRLKEVRMIRSSGWSAASRANLEAFAAKLRERDPAATVRFW